MRTFFLSPEGRWWVLTEHGGRAVTAYGNKRDALRGAAKRASFEFGAIFVLHPDGTVEEERRYPPPGTKPGTWASAQNDSRRHPASLAVASVELMACKLVPTLPDGPEWHYEINLDGYRCVGSKSGKQTGLYSRQHKDFPQLIQTLTPRW